MLLATLFGFVFLNIHVHICEMAKYFCCFDWLKFHIFQYHVIAFFDYVQFLHMRLGSVSKKKSRPISYFYLNMLRHMSYIWDFLK